MSIRFDSTKVIKVENCDERFQNVMEWETWNSCKDIKGLSKWLAPCYAISHSGTFLIMERTLDLRLEEMPKLLPQFIDDRKIENLGMLNGQVVARDYGYIISNLSARLTKVK